MTPNLEKRFLPSKTVEEDALNSHFSGVLIQVNVVRDLK